MLDFLNNGRVLSDSEVHELVRNKAARVMDINFNEMERRSFTAIEGAEVRGGERVKFVIGALIVDWACYDAEADRADFQRLYDVFSAFPRGFRLWLCQTASGEQIPVAYTGWYPISPSAFEKAHTAPNTLLHRRELWPLNGISQDGNYIWLFNYSIIASLRRSIESRRMLKEYAEDIKRIPVLGMAAAVLSEASKSVVAKFGMTYSGDMMHDGVAENVFSTKLVMPRPS